jgi:mercuric ion transport protein
MTLPDGPAVSPEATSDRRVLASVGAVFAAFLASLCCIGPLVFVALGVGAGLASTFEPLRPVFTAATLILLAVGFYAVYGRAAEATGCAEGASCPVPRDRRRDKMLLWTATLLAAALLSFPQWSKLLV